MKILLTAILLSAVIFTIVDIIWLSYSVKNFYRPNLGDLLNERPVFWAAILFYLIYMLGLAILVIYPSLNYDSLISVFFQGVIFGLVTYGTYNLTNMATIKNWSPNVVFVDMFWGALLTGTSVSLGVYLTKKIFLL